MRGREGAAGRAGKAVYFPACVGRAGCLHGLRMPTVTLFSPAKVNLSLAITGRRADGFHQLLSVVAPLAWGDTLHATWPGETGPATLICDAPWVPTDGTNLILRAADAFAAATGWRGRVVFQLEKRIPVGAGLGGGSSNAVAALRALEALSGIALGLERRLVLAAGLGSDCPLFCHDGPVLMRGRGEHTRPLGAEAAARLRGRRILLFKPVFGVATAEAYAALAARPEWYAGEAAEEARLAAWEASAGAPAEELLGNTLERPVFAKWLALPAMLAWLRERHGVEARMSGSGSACFLLLRPGQDEAPLVQTLREGWGAEAFVHTAQLG